MRKCLPIALLCVMLALASPLRAAPNFERLHAVRSFAFALGSDVLINSFDTLKSYDLVVIDAEEATTAQVEELQASGALVLGYLSVGTIERGRFWYKRAKPFRLDFWEDFGEWYADTSDLQFRNLIMKRVVPRFVGKGFEGLFLDNVDMIREHRAQRAGMRTLVRKIAAYLHSRDLYLFAQNGEDVLGRIFNSLDGWNREDVTSTYNFDTGTYQVLSDEEIDHNLLALQSVISKGILVTATDYVAPDDSTNKELARTNACSMGVLPFVSNIELTLIPESPASCD